MCNEIMRHFLSGGGGPILRQKFSLSPPQAAVLLRLLEFNDPELGCYPAEKTIADWTAMSVKTVEKAIAALKEKGCFQCEKRVYRDSRGRERSGQRNHYVFSEEVDRLVEECAAIGKQHARRQIDLKLESDKPTTPPTEGKLDQLPLRERGSWRGGHDANYPSERGEVSAGNQPTTPPTEGKLDQLPLRERGSWRGGHDANYPSERGEVSAGNQPTTPPTEGKLDQLPLRERGSWRGGHDANYPSERGEVSAGNQPTTPPTEGKLDQLPLRERGSWRGGHDANYPSERGEVSAGNQPTTPPTEGKLDQLPLREGDRSKEGRNEGKKYD